ncbi:MAG: EthD domain-containing protein [Myxococcales bacterium]|nr:EthD domain-containing protein [Myxococcales bacterium]
MIKLAVLLQRKPGMSFEAFDRHWDGPHGDLVVGIPEFMRHVRRYSQSHVVDPSYEGAGMEWQAAKIDGIAEVSFDDVDAMTAAFNEPRFVELVGTDDAQFIDGGAVSVLVTQEIEKIPLNGSPAVKLSVAIKRPDGMSFDAFDTYWNTTHAEIVTSVPEFTRHVRRYVQSHIIQEYTGADDRSKLTNQWSFAPFDGIAELWFDDAAEVVRAFNEPAFIETIAPDDVNFVDQAGTKLLVVQEIEKFPNLVHRYSN